MKIVIGGSYHYPNWNEIKKIMTGLKEVGHEILMPAGDEPIDANADFVKFAGEENISTADIEQQFLHYACEEADALVIVDGGGYLGQAITIELCKAALVNLTNYRRFRIYFTEQPMVFHELDKGQECSLLFADGKKVKFLGPDELCKALQQNGLKITQEKYDELYPHHWKLYEIYHQYPGLFQIGIDELYEPEKIGELPTIPGTGNGRQIF